MYCTFFLIDWGGLFLTVSYKTTAIVIADASTFKKIHNYLDTSDHMRQYCIF